MKRFVFFIFLCLSSYCYGQNEEQQSENKSIIPGYYLVTNAFSKQENVDRWMEQLTKLGFEPLSFVHPKNSLTYVYIAYETNSFMLRDMLIAAREFSILKESWIKHML